MKQTSLLQMKKDNSPKDFATLLRKMGDIFWWASGNFWVINSYEYARQILTSHDFTCDRTDFFVSRMPELDLTLIGDFFAVISKMMVMSDYPEFSNRRRICYHGFTSQFLEQLDPIIIKTINKQLDFCIGKNSIEFVSDLAKIVPSVTLAEFFNIPENDRENFYNWSNNMTQFFGGASSYQNDDGITVNKSAKNLQSYFIDLIEERTKQPKNDFLSLLLSHKKAFGMDNDEIVSQAIMMLVAGQITTTDQLCNNIYTLFNDELSRQLLRQQPHLIDTALDELNRLDPAVTFIFRVAKQNTAIGTQKIAKGEVVFISTHAVNRDPTQFHDPDQCILSRTANKQISYGYGGHYCLGAKLAKTEMKLCLSALINRFDDIRFDPTEPPIRKHHSLAFSGFEKIPLLFNNS